MAKPRIVVVDYKLGNIYNLSRALMSMEVEVEVTDSPEIIRHADKLILPGVGAFPTGIRNINNLGLYDTLVEFKNSGKDMLGICLGMQLLLDSAEENGFYEGFGFISGQVRLMQSSLDAKNRCKIPQISWNTLTKSKACLSARDHGLLKLIPEPVYMYFIHSYAVYVNSAEDVVAHTSYGDNNFCSVIAKDNVYGCQFHPEVSGEAGLLFLENFIKLS